MLFTCLCNIFFLSLFLQALLPLVHINPKLIRKIRLTRAPESLEELHDGLREKLALEGEFCIQYEDPGFGDALCNLVDITELPSEKAVLHIVWSNDETPSTSKSQSLVLPRASWCTNITRFQASVFLFCICVIQICHGFLRVTTKDLLGTFRAALERYSPQLLKLYRARKGAFGQELEDLLGKLDKQVDLLLQ